MLKWTACAPNAVELYPELFKRDDGDIPAWMESPRAGIESSVEGKSTRHNTLISGSFKSKLDVQVRYYAAARVIDCSTFAYRSSRHPVLKW